MKIYLVRHGMPEGAEKGPRYLGLTDEPLCEEGKRQAREAGRMIRQMDPLSRMSVMSSPLKRCAETAEILSEYACCGPSETNEGLREINLGAWDGKYVSEIRDTLPEEYDSRGRDLLNYRIPGGETFAEAGERFSNAVKEIVCFSVKDEAIVIVAHAGVIRAGLSFLTNTPFEEFMHIRIPYAGIIPCTVEFEQGGEAVFTAEISLL